MSRLTKIIAVEGIDGSGKTLQWQKLEKTLRDRDVSVQTLSFPNYDGFFGEQVGHLLRGDAIRADLVDSRSMCLWYALDRWDTMKEYRDGQSDYLLINRYTLSNAVYQSIREIDAGREDNWDWVRRLEHEKFGLPQPDVYVLLDIDPAIAQRNVDKKNKRGYVEGRDVYEAQHGLLQRARARYLDIAAREQNIEVIACMEDSAQALRNPASIFDCIWEKLRVRGLLEP